MVLRRRPDSSARATGWLEILVSPETDPAARIVSAHELALQRDSRAAQLIVMALKIEPQFERFKQQKVNSEYHLPDAGRRSQ